jgi:hypothetical protein
VNETSDYYAAPRLQIIEHCSAGGHSHMSAITYKKSYYFTTVTFKEHLDEEEALLLVILQVLLS